MAEQQVDEDVTADDAEVAAGYQAPAQKSVKDIISTDAEDESLRKYKEALLGSAVGGGVVEVCKYQLKYQSVSPTRKLRCCVAQLLHFRATAQFL